MKDEHQHDVDEAAIRKLIGEEWSMDRIVKFCGHIMADKVRASDKVESPGTVRSEAGPANNARAEICAVIVEGDSPCTYCARDLDTSCNSDLCDSRFSGFKGRKLSPVAQTLV